jgi:putative spermidine/putrescine transport system ATP-binding protein
MIAGFEQPDRGDIRVNGAVLNGVPPRKRDVGIVFQSYALFPTMTVRQNVAFGLVIARRPAAEVRRRVDELLGLVKLEPLADRYPHQLSGGQQQRVALARALARRPPILLLDEPLSALDAKIRMTLRAEIRKVQQQVGITAIYVTHDQEEALSISDRIAVMRGGRIEQVGTPVEIYSRPRTPFVADFVGLTNLLECRVVDPAAGDVTFEGRPLAVPTPVPAAAGASVWVSIRPEKVRLASRVEAPPAGANRLEGTLELVTFLGASARAEASVGARAFWVDLPHSRALGYRRQDAVALHFAPADCVVIAA